MSTGVTCGRTWQLLNLLADGEFHSGQVLAKQLGVTRASVFNALADVSDYGVALQRVRGRGYRLASPWQRLESDEIYRYLGSDAGQFDIEIFSQVVSSNSLLLQRAALAAVNQGVTRSCVIAAELQTGGRGRMGRIWHSGLGTSLTFSLLWRFECGLNALSGLSLAVGIAMVRALNSFAAQDVRLKWPNDIMTAHGKLGGVLIEAQGDMLGPSAVVIGVGLNCTMPTGLASQIEQSASALDEVCATPPTRNQLLARMLQELSHVLQRFSQDGFGRLRDEWESYHLYQNKPVTLQMPDGQTLTGIARGVSDIGELCLETPKGMKRVNSGEVEISG